MRLYGHDACQGCKVAKMMLDKYNIPYEFIDVSTLNFQGEIPQLELDDGVFLIGAKEIINWIRQKRG